MSFTKQYTLLLQNDPEQSGVTEQISPPRRPGLARRRSSAFSEATFGLKPRTALTTVYATGLRVAEAVWLTTRTYDSARMVIHVRHGKGGRDRYVMLSEQLLTIFRDYWNSAFAALAAPGSDPARPITARSLQRACRRGVQAAGLDKHVTVHTLRSSLPLSWNKGSSMPNHSRTCSGIGRISATARYARGHSQYPFGASKPA